MIHGGETDYLFRHLVTESILREPSLEPLNINERNKLRVSNLESHFTNKGCILQIRGAFYKRGEE